MYYIDVSKEQVEDLRPAIDLLVQLWGEDLDKGAIYLYGMVDSSSPVIAGMNASINAKGITYGVVAIALNSDSLYFLTGSGYAMKHETFAYVENQEIRTGTFTEAQGADTVVTLSSFTKMAVASSDSWMDRFLKLENPEALDDGKEDEEVERSESGTNVEHGGLVHEEAELPQVKSSSAIDVWAETNIEDWSVSELYQLLHKLSDERADTEEATFFLWSASDLSGYLIHNDAASAAKYIASKLRLDPSEIASEGATVTGRQLASIIEDLLGGE